MEDKISKLIDEYNRVNNFYFDLNKFKSDTIQCIREYIENVPDEFFLDKEYMFSELNFPGLGGGEIPMDIIAEAIIGLGRIHRRSKDYITIKDSIRSQIENELFDIIVEEKKNRSE